SAWSGNHFTNPLSEIRSLSTDYLPSLIKASVCGSRLASYSARVSQFKKINSLQLASISKFVSEINKRISVFLHF
ncbi:hypothetical protein, partial [Peribacillus simplex]|uniref:hypothetical protein n=1 Tax=Peribacillus simplex TaxID=1478 RepID=UPI003D26F0DC